MVNSPKDEPSFACARYFRGLMPDAKSTKGWAPACRILLDTYCLTPDELKAFMHWATQENTDPKPQFNSVEYLALAADPMKSLVKNAENLVRVWRAKQRSKTAFDSEVAASTPPIPGRDPWLDTPAGEAWVAEQMRKYPIKRMKLTAR